MNIIKFTFVYNTQNSILNIFSSSLRLLCVLNIILVKVPFAGRKHYDHKASWSKMDLFGLHFRTAVYHRRKSGQKLIQDRIPEARADVEVMEGCCLLT